MADDAALLSLIERIYEAATDPSALGHLAPALAREFRCDTGLLYIVQNPQQKSTDLLLSATDNFDDWAHASYTGYYRRLNEWSNRVIEQRAPGAAQVMGRDDLFDERTFVHTEIYADYYRKIGMFHTIAGLFPVNGKELGVAVLSRPQSARDYTGSERRRLALLVPHLQRAYQIHQRLSAAEQERALTFDMLDRLSLGAVIVDQHCRIVFANPLAQRLFQGGLGVTVSRGCVRAAGVERGLKLDQVVHEAALTGAGQGFSSGGLVVIARSGTSPLSIMVSPFRSAAIGRSPVAPTALLMFSDPDAESYVPEEVLGRVLGLAHAEARLLSALVAGQTISNYADSVGITLNTAKTQLRQIFLKTGHNRQSDVIRAVLSDPLMKLVTTQETAAVTLKAAE